MKKSFLKVAAVVAFAGVAAQVYAEKNPVLPAPNPARSAEKQAKVLGWGGGQMPIPATGFEVSSFADLKSPRSLFLMTNGDVLVSQAEKHPDDSGETSPNQITLLKLNGSTLISQNIVVNNLHLPFGMAVKENELYVGEPEQVIAFPFDGTKVTGPSRVIASLPFPKPQRHWTRHLLFSNDFSKLYVSVGSASNVGEDGDPLDPRTAAILEMNPDGSDARIFASGLRNPVSMAWEPSLGHLWTVVNERDELGDNLPPDYLTHVQEDGFYGWPYAYWGKHEDPRLSGQRPDLVSKSITPDYAVGAHTASLGVTFTTGTAMPAPFKEGALIAQHGSWNRSTFAGYKIHFVPFKDGEALDGEENFLTGFVADEAAGEVYGRPVSTVILADGSVLVADDAGGKIWKVSPKKAN